MNSTLINKDRISHRTLESHVQNDFSIMHNSPNHKAEHLIFKIKASLILKTTLNSEPTLKGQLSTHY